MNQAQSYGLVSQRDPFLERLSETAFNSSGAEVFPDLSPEDLAVLNAVWGFDNKDA